ncbi:MAG TPA: hemerythrin domain-containing protein [Nitrososphaera sp.]
MSTRELKQDHVTVRRIRDIAQCCSDRLYEGAKIPLEDIDVISVVIEEFIDAFHHGKEEKAYFPSTEIKSDAHAEEVRKFKIEHEFGRRVAQMMRRHLKEWKSGVDGREPVARFLKTYAIYVTDHTGKEDGFFDMIEEMKSLTDEEDRSVLKHYEMCRKDVGGNARIEELLRLISWLEERDWMH